MNENIHVPKNDWQTIPIKSSSAVNKRKLPSSPKITKLAKIYENVDTSNRFSPINIDDDSDDDDSIGNQNTHTETENDQPKPPPIVIPHINNINDMLKKFCTIINKREFKFTTTRDGQVRVMVENLIAYRKLIKYLESCDTLFHTYQVKQERAYRVIIKNLHYTTNTDDIKNELLAHGHDVRNIINVRQRYTKEPLSMFFLDLEPKENNKDVYQIKHLNNAIIRIEPPRKVNDIVQCHRCQQFGHTKAYCKKPYKCVKCSLDHATSACKKDVNAPPQCVHCLQSHTANYKGCTFYQELLNKKTQNKPFQTQRRQMNNENYNYNQNVHDRFSPNEGETYASICKQQNHSENSQFSKLENLLTKQIELTNTLISMMCSLMQKLCK